MPVSYTHLRSLWRKRYCWSSSYFRWVAVSSEIHLNHFPPKLQLCHFFSEQQAINQALWWDISSSHDSRAQYHLFLTRIWYMGKFPSNLSTPHGRIILSNAMWAGYPDKLFFFLGVSFHITNSLSIHAVWHNGYNWVILPL